MNKNFFAKTLRYELMMQFEKNDRNGVYAKLQKMMAYNSNKIEGSTLTSEQTASLFDTGTIFAEENMIFRSKDIEEMTGHFKMFNHMLKTLEQPLSEELIKAYHFHLKTGVFEDVANGYPIGEYKNRANTVSDIVTSTPEMTADSMKTLLGKYETRNVFNMESLLQFHAEFEHVHPFQDGNGRVGRMILLKECLRHNIIPIIIRDETKAEYYHVLHEAQINNNYAPIVKYGKKQQDLFVEEIKDFLPDMENEHINERKQEMLQDKSGIGMEQ